MGRQEQLSNKGMSQQMNNESHSPVPAKHPQFAKRPQLDRRLKAIAVTALLAVAATAVTGCGAQPRAPQARHVSASVYGHDSRSVTSDVYSLQQRHNW
ncbi:hypothetical protein COLU111180_05145 [Cohnella lubricantis]|uniref:Uncharacterized protein n=1 Tax=Cohnella lubricantis TaxID=2163172 RepID=A0A841TB57_9BACL|nr:hypothetical protein [Cohnella lubricantis]MBB6677269.1 hypothetical protein [Cohnella lubricantis]MBP2116919.1 hypothetical protein [Cohnella lubricantis]